MMILGVLMAVFFAALFVPFWWLVNKVLIGAETVSEVKDRAIPLAIVTTVLLAVMLTGGALIEWVTSKASFIALF